MRQISSQTDEYWPTKKIKQFHTQMNLPFGYGGDEEKILLPIFWDESGAEISAKTQ